jgi:hypothetical protein
LASWAGWLISQSFRRNLRAEITRARTHIAVRQLEPRPGERIGELVWMLHEAPRNLFVGGVQPQRDVGGQHGRPVFLRRVVRIRHRGALCGVLKCVRFVREVEQLALITARAFQNKGVRRIAPIC